MVQWCSAILCEITRVKQHEWSIRITKELAYGSVETVTDIIFGSNVENKTTCANLRVSKNMQYKQFMRIKFANHNNIII